MLSLLDRGDPHTVLTHRQTTCPCRHHHQVYRHPLCRGGSRGELAGWRMASCRRGRPVKISFAHMHSFSYSSSSSAAAAFLLTVDGEGRKEVSCSPPPNVPLPSSGKSRRECWKKTNAALPGFVSLGFETKVVIWCCSSRAVSNIRLPLGTTTSTWLGEESSSASLQKKMIHITYKNGKMLCPFFLTQLPLLSPEPG